MIVLSDFRHTKPSRPADLIFSDVPYNIGHDYGPVSDNIPEPEYLLMMHDFARWSWENSNDDAWLAVMHYPEFFFMNGRETFLPYGWNVLQRIAWVYNSNIGHSRSKFTRASRDIWVFYTKETQHLTRRLMQCLTKIRPIHALRR